MPTIVYHVRLIHGRLRRVSISSSEKIVIEPYSALNIYKEDPNMSSIKDMALPICVGKDESHQPHFEDLAKMPHVLIAGLTGFGKSKNSVEVHAIDPKQTGFSRFLYSEKPKISVICKEKEYKTKLNELVNEMDKRNELMRSFGFKDIVDYNDNMRVQLPYIVLLIDEFQDLERKQQDGLKKLARMGRSAGIHLVLGTQNPNGNDIDPTILQQLAGIICFRLRNKAASERILGEGGAEKLAEKGEMIFKCATNYFKGRAPLCELKDFDFYPLYRKAQAAKIAAFEEKTEKRVRRGRPPKEKDHEKIV